jgi:hypothetical protein
MIIITLHDVLRPFSTVEYVEQGGATRAEKLKREALKKELADARARNRLIFRVLIGMIVSLFMVAVAGVVFNLNRPEVVWGVHGAFGGLAAFLLYFLIHAWREVSRMDLLIVLVEFMELGALQTLVNELVKTTGQGAPPMVKVS